MVFNRYYEKDDPFPMDISYQEQQGRNLFSKQYKAKRKKEEMMRYAISKDEKIPIVISGTYSIHIQIDAGEDISCGNFCGEKFGKSVEKGIESAIAGIKHNAGVHLRLVKERRIMPSGNEWIAEKILNHKDCIENLFKLIYFDYNKEEVESQLGKYSSLEKAILPE
jgi:hypothetical protein